MTSRCPICHAEVDFDTTPTHRPFCSARCKKQDLANWLDGVYRLPRELSPADLDELSPEEQSELLEALGGGKLLN